MEDDRNTSLNSHLQTDVEAELWFRNPAKAVRGHRRKKRLLGRAAGTEQQIDRSTGAAAPATRRTSHRGQAGHEPDHPPIRPEITLDEPVNATTSAAERVAEHPPAAIASKRVLDLVLAAAALVLLLPLWLGLAVLIVVLDGRPVLYRQERVGRHGRPFSMVKLRTMVRGADQRHHEVALLNQRSGPLFKVADDPRVTRSGRWLRVTSLDELPQLLNVLRGDMSLVGPRPALFAERAEFPPELLRRERVRPGITGPWQLHGRLIADFESYRRLDLEYVHDWTLRGDLVLLLRTPFVVVRHAWRRAVIVAEAEAAPEGKVRLVSRLEREQVA
jgi:lipopolysaccharide/colanic/teichoic acid biosynthesis glycosyltransferase